MKHLSEEGLLELLEDGAPELSHLETCTVCRGRFEALRQTMGLLRDDPVPEPSPLFWQHLSERVRLAIDDAADEPHSVPWWTRRGWHWALTGAAALGIAALVVVTSQRVQQTDSVANRTGSSALPAASAAPEDLAWAIPADDSWAMVVDVAEGLDLESAADAGLVVRPGSIDQALLRLSDEERRDLAGIIQAELDRLSL
jgi:hypothetical protein